MPPVVPYFDCNATSPIDHDVAAVVTHYLTAEYGNAGSRTHERGARAKAAVQRAREHVARVVDSDPSEVVFTSGATESDNLAILGLVAFAERTGRRHIVSTSIEHKAVLEPLQYLAGQGFDVELVAPAADGVVDPQAIASTLRPDTLLVSIMHVNNETGTIQRLDDIADALGSHEVYLHVDAAQGFGKDLAPLHNKRIDLISVSAHKIYGPKGVGALLTRRRGFDRPPLEPLMFGGGQERGLRPGTLPVHLIAGLGEASRTAISYHDVRLTRVLAIRSRLRQLLDDLGASVNGSEDRCIPSTLNASLRGVDAEAAMVALKGVIEISNGSACTSSSYEPSHVLQAMRLPESQLRGALRFSWCHLTEEPDWDLVKQRLRQVARRV